jgi:hypothetical protein
MPNGPLMESRLLSALEHATLLFIVGGLIGLGQLLASREKLRIRLVVGRAITWGALGVAASAALMWFPDLPLSAQIGTACVLASLGTSGLERIAQRIFGAN